MPLIWNRFASLRWYFLLIATFTYAYILFSYNGGSLNGLFDDIIVKTINSLFWTANGWFWMLSLIAWAQYYFTATNPVLRYLNRGVFCFYILHQTLIIVVAYWLVPKQLGGFVESTLIIVTVAIGCWVVFEVIRRLPVLPLFFGIQGR